MKIFFQNYAYFGGFLTLCEGHKADEIFKEQNAWKLRKQKKLLSLFIFFLKTPDNLAPLSGNK